MMRAGTIMADNRSCAGFTTETIHPGDAALVEAILMLGTTLKDKDGLVCPTLRLPPAMVMAIIDVMRSPDPVERARALVKTWAAATYQKSGYTYCTLGR